MFTLTSLRNVAPWTALAMFVSGCAPSGDKPSSVLEETSFEDDFGFVRFAPIGPCDPRVESGLGGPNKFTIVAWLNKEGGFFPAIAPGSKRLMRSLQTLTS
ncbi:MAG TPA: hypothetical protein VFY87_25840 [Geminicoccaceae bacterium]|nr:hypothetical protein [Geminicoccaceae bacterium]